MRNGAIFAMAKVYKCDRCGEIFDYEHINISSISASAYVVKDISFGTASGSSVYFDLCDECQKDFVIFLKNEDSDD